MSRPDPICPRCNWPHAGDAPCFGQMDKDDCETTLDELLRLADERGDKELDSHKSDN